MDPLSTYELWQLRLAAAKAAGFPNWASFAEASGRSLPMDMEVMPLRFREDLVLLVMNKHRVIPEGALRNRCAIFENLDVLVLRSCTH